MSETLREAESEVKMSETIRDLKSEARISETIRDLEISLSELGKDDEPKKKVREPVVVNVFTHSSTEFPGAWAEDEITQLLDTWEEVMGRVQFPKKRFHVVKKVTSLLRQQGMMVNGAKVNAKAVDKQMKKLRTEYKVYQGLLIIGHPTYRDPCVDQLDRILRVQRSRRQSKLSEQEDDRPEEMLTTGRKMDTIEEVVQSEGRKKSREEAGNPEKEGGGKDMDDDDEADAKQRRANSQRRLTVRFLMQQQQNTLDQLVTLVKGSEESNLRVVELLSELVVIRKAEIVLQEKILEAINGVGCMSSKELLVDP